MTVTRLLLIATVAALATLPAVWLIPRARQSPMFDRILWGATWVLAFIGAWIAPSYLIGTLPADDLIIAQVPVISTSIGALGGALSINLLLWLMDRFDRPGLEEDFAEEEAREQDDGRKNSEPD